MVATGGSYPHAENVEIIDLLDPQWKIEFMDTRAARYGAVGGLIQDKPVICGGISSTSSNHCILTKDYICLDNPNDNFSILEERLNASNVQLDQKTLWITGGQFKKSTEFITLDKSPLKGPDLPFIIHHHTMVSVNSKTIYIIGGYQNEKMTPSYNSNITNKTWIVDPTKNYSIKSGQSLNEARYAHSCTKMKIQGKTFLVVAGGANENDDSLDSVELLDTECPDEGWIIGKQLK